MASRLLALVVVVTTARIAAAEPRTIRGQVVTADGGAPIEAAVVFASDGALATSAADGRFAVEVGDGAVELSISAPGYAARVVPLADVRGALRIALAPVASGEVIEIAGAAAEATRPTEYALTGDQIRTLPGAGNASCAPRRACPASRASRSGSAAWSCAAALRATPTSTSTASRCRSPSTSAASPRSTRRACSPSWPS